MMKICAAIGSADEIEKHILADLAEIRLDVFKKIPNNLSVPRLITFKDTPDYNILPNGFNEMIDVGESEFPITDATVLSSYHDMVHTPNATKIADIMNGMKGDITKGAFAVNQFTDLTNIYKASKMLGKKHVLIGMGELGMITRVRSDILKNEFTFAHTGTPTAIGQLSIEEMRKLGDDCTITGIVGHPLSHSLSQKLHNQAFKDTDVNGIYLKFDVLSLDDIENVIRYFNIRGLNITIPYKTDIIRHLDKIDKTAEAIGAVNTITNLNGCLTGTNTDVAGINAAFKHASIKLNASKKILIIGSGGSAKACTYTFRKKDANVFIVGRNINTVTELCRRFDCTPVTNIDPTEYDIIVNCTPMGMYAEAVYPLDISEITSDQAVFDLVYNVNTPLKILAKERGCKVIDGMDMLIGQGLKSFNTWTKKTPNFNNIKKAIL